MGSCAPVLFGGIMHRRNSLAYCCMTPRRDRDRECTVRCKYRATLASVEMVDVETLSDGESHRDQYLLISIRQVFL